MGQTFYIDPHHGEDARSGLAPAQAWQTYASRPFAPGDVVLFKRGSVVRDVLFTRDGSAEGAITYGAYGEGDKPVFMGSQAADGARNWVEESPSVWRFTGSFPSEVCNLIFNGGPTCGNLRWTLAELKHQGEWYYTDTGPRSSGDPSTTVSASLYLYSTSNPGLYYSSIEAALWGQRRLVGGKQFVTLENLVFKNAGVHGYRDVGVRGITIRHCEFLYIGGAVFDRKQKVRFGNAVEFWDGAVDVVVENCLFDKIYDSGITPQGGGTRNVPRRLYFRNNLFIDNGMAAYEAREPAQEVYFENNTCVNAGGEFTMQGEPPPRRSENYPQPMGHHVLIWLIEKNTQPGTIHIQNNIFFEAPYGAAIYSCIDPVDERKFVIDDNCYWQTTGTLLNKLNNQSYRPADWERYQKETGQDHRSLLADPRFVNPAAGNYRLQPDSPAKGKGVLYP